MRWRRVVLCWSKDLHCHWCEATETWPSQYQPTVEPNHHSQSCASKPTSTTNTNSNYSSSLKLQMWTYRCASISKENKCCCNFASCAMTVATSVFFHNCKRECWISKIVYFKPAKDLPGVHILRNIVIFCSLGVIMYAKKASLYCLSFYVQKTT